MTLLASSYAERAIDFRRHAIDCRSLEHHAKGWPARMSHMRMAVAFTALADEMDGADKMGMAPKLPVDWWSWKRAH